MKYLLMFMALSAMADDVVVSWDPSPSSNMVAGYQVHYGTVKRTSSDPFGFRYQKTNFTSKTTFSMLVTNLSPGIWYFSATATATNGMISTFSNEVSWTNRNFSPAFLRLTGPEDALILQAAGQPQGPWKTLAVITSSNPPLNLEAKPHQSFRTITTNKPPLPR